MTPTNAVEPLTTAVRAVAARSADAVLEATVVGSFTRVGFSVRRALGQWDDEDATTSLAGRTVLVTGATSGIGLAAATRLVRLGARLHFLGRNAERARQVQERLQAESSHEVGFDLVDMSDFAAVRGFAARFAEACPTLDVLVHNAGALSATFETAPDGTELTLASHVLGPFLLTSLLLPSLRSAGPGRVLTMSSGGMYTQRFAAAELEMNPANYDGTIAYARAKRAQVMLTHEWAQRVPASDVVFHSMHPGWADTPGVESSLPGFYRVMRPLLRTPEQGADTAVWLASAPEALEVNGAFWHDRRRRSEHRVPWTRSDESAAAVWDLCMARTGAETPEKHQPVMFRATTARNITG